MVLYCRSWPLKKMLTCLLVTCLKWFIILGCNKFGKKGKDLFDAIVDDLVRALEHHTWYRMHFMGKLKGIRPNHIELPLWEKRCFALDTCNFSYLYDVCYQTSCKSCNSLYIWCNSLQFNYKFDATTPFQLLCNSLMTTIIRSCWHHFSSIHQNLTRGTMKKFGEFFKILISIIHYDYSFRWSWIMTCGILIEIWKQIYVCI